MAFNKKDKQSQNYLDFVPRRVETYKWEQDEEGNVTIFVENKGAFNRIAQKFFKKPEVSQIHLQGIGNYIWPLIDGRMSIYELGVKVKEHYGEEAEPLYERLSEYMRMLDEYGFITFD
jgi:hypothetical protein